MLKGVVEGGLVVLRVAGAVARTSCSAHAPVQLFPAFLDSFDQFYGFPHRALLHILLAGYQSTSFFDACVNDIVFLMSSS